MEDDDDIDIYGDLTNFEEKTSDDVNDFFHIQFIGYVQFSWNS